MPYNGSGTYAAPALPGSWNPATTGSSATPADWNTLLADLSTALTTCVTKDGQTTLSAAGVTSLRNQLVGQTVTFETGALATGSTTIPQDDTIPQNTEGVEYMSVTITPKSATSTLVINVIAYGATNPTANITVALFQDTTANALAAVSMLQGQVFSPVSIPLTHKMTSGSVAATTFKVRIGGAAGEFYTFNGSNAGRLYGGVAASSIVINEVIS